MSQSLGYRYFFYLSTTIRYGNKFFRSIQRICDCLEPFVVMVVVMSMSVVVEPAEPALLVISDVLVSDQNTRSMSVQIVGHIVTLLLHVVTELIK